MTASSTDAKTSIHKPSTFFRSTGPAEPTLQLTPTSGSTELDRIKQDAIKTSYKDTFVLFNQLEGQILGLYAIYQDSHTKIENHLNTVIQKSHLYQNWADAQNSIEEKRAENLWRQAAFNQAKEAYEAKKEDKEKLTSLTLMLFYYATVMQEHYKRYDHKEKIKQYEEMADEAEQFIKKMMLVDKNINDIKALSIASQKMAKTEKEEQSHFMIYLIREAAKDTQNLLKNIKDGLLRTSKWRDALNAVNMQRIYWIFCHFVMSQLQHMAIKIQLQLTHLFHKDMSWLLAHADKLGKMMDGPKDFLNVLSVALFGIRFVIDVLMIIKHASDYFSTDKEKEVGQKARAWAEFEKRFFDMANNVVWGTANLLTNYNKLFHISDPIAMQIVAALLVFDALLIVLRLLKAQRQYRSNRMALLIERKALENELGKIKRDLLAKSRVSDDDAEKQALLNEKQRLLDELKINRLQIKALDDNWAVQKASYEYYIIAAVILCASFAATLFAVPPAGVLVCYIVGIAAMAMYLSVDQYSDFVAKKKKYEDAKEKFDSQKATKEDTIELQRLKKDFIKAKRTWQFAMVEKTVVPTIIMIAFASNVFVGAGVLGLYLLCKLSLKVYHKYQARQKQAETRSNRYSMFQEVNDGPKLTRQESIELDKLEKKKPEREVTSLLPEADLAGLDFKFA